MRFGRPSFGSVAADLFYAMVTPAGLDNPLPVLTAGDHLPTDLCDAPL